MRDRERSLTTLVAISLVIHAIFGGSASARSMPSAAGLRGEAASPTAALLDSRGHASSIQAQANTTRFERVSVEDGLSQSVVLAILQDQQGFMWFATQDGLNRYDGYQFTVYKHDPDDPTALSNNYVRTIYEDRSGELWVGTRSGLDRLDRTTGTFIHYQHDPSDPHSLGGTEVVAVHEDRAGSLWIGIEDGGVSRLDRATNAFTHYRHDPDDPTTLAHDYVWTIYEDRSEELWVGTDGGLDRLDRTTGMFTHYDHDAADTHSLSDNRVRVIVEDRQGALWIGLEGGGLDRFDRSTQSFTHYQHDPDDPHSLSDNLVWAIREDREGRLWVGTQAGLDQLDRRQNGFVHFRHDPYDPHSLSGDSVESIYEDQAGVLWLGTFGGGLSKLNLGGEKFALYRHRSGLPNTLSDDLVWSVHEDQSGVLWVGTFDGGLNRLDRRAGTIAVYEHDPDDSASLSSNEVRAVIEDHLGILWVGTNYGGLNQFDPRTEQFVRYRHDPNDPDSLSEDRIRVLHEDRSGNLWIGTWSEGLDRLDRGTGTFVHYRHDADDPLSLSDNRVRAIHEDREGTLWIGTSGGGINLLDDVSGRFTHYRHDPDDLQSLSSDVVFSFCEDPSGTVWIGTIGGGLNRFDRPSRTFANYTERDGLPNDAVYGILADAAGVLWLSTNNGLSRFDPRTETFRNYDASDGLQNNEFNAGAYFQSGGGEMFFGGIQGLNAFYPEQVEDNPHIPPIVITAFSKFNEVARRDLSADEHIQLSYKDNFISFEFAALDYAAPAKNEYAYMLEGQDQDWVYAGTRRHADYTNLKGGNYTFRVKGSNNDGIWNEQGTAIGITVTPPIWDRWWFRGIVLLVLAGAAVGGFRLRVRSIEARSLELERQVSSRSRDLEVLHRAERRRAEQFRLISEVGRRITSILPVDELLEQITTLLKEAFDYGVIGIGLIEGDELVFRAGAVAFANGSQLNQPLRIRVGQEGISGWVAQSGEALLVPDVSQEPRYYPVPQATETRSELAVPLTVKGDIIGVLDVESDRLNAFDGSDLVMMQSLANQAAIAIENARLYERAQELAVVQERQRLARDLHDAVSQTLFSASLIAEVLPGLWDRNEDDGRRRLEELRELTRGALAEMRTLLLELRPTALVDAQLSDLLNQLAESTTGRARIPVTLEVEGECSLPPDVKVALYRIAQESVNNVAKHAGASQVTMTLRCTSAMSLGPDGEQEQSERVELRVHDDGRGFDPTSIRPDCLGVGIMHERAQAIGITLTVESEVGRGTEVVAAWTGTSR